LEAWLMQRIARFVPGVLGAVLVCAGVAFLFWPAGLIAVGGFLLWLDWRLQ